MNRRFRINKNYYNEDEQLFSKGVFTIKPGITVLIGCNGSGKTTLIEHIRSRLDKINYEAEKDPDKKEIPYVFYDDKKNGGINSANDMLFAGDTAAAASLMCSSEGERILINLGEKAAKEIGVMQKEHPDADEYWILLDAVDSGFSIDNVVYFKEFLHDLLDRYIAGKDVYILVSANAYEMARGEACFDLCHMEYCRMDTYDDYREYILQSAKIKELRYRKEE